MPLTVTRTGQMDTSDVPQRAEILRDYRDEYERVCRDRDRLLALNEAYQASLDVAPIAYLHIDVNGVVVSANHRARAMLAMTTLGRPSIATVRLVHADSRRALGAHLSAVHRSGEAEVELLMQRQDGSCFPALLRSVSVAEAGGRDHAVLMAVIDISPLKQTELSLRHAHNELEVLAHSDELTGLPNRTHFLERLRQSREEAARHHRVGALLFLDVDRFKVINDSMGHDAGDTLLKHVATGLKQAVRAGDTVARMGGDEFTVILNDVINVENAHNVARKLLRAINRPVTLGEHRVRPSFSIGMCLFTQLDCSERELMKSADQAMYAAKQQGGNRIAVFDRNVDYGELCTLERDLHGALEQGQLTLRFQPQYDAAGAVVAHEALLRWQHPQRGLVAPSEFVPIAERAGLIREIGEWVLHEACRRNMAATAAGRSPLRIAVNVSPRQLAEEDFLATVERVLTSTGHPGHALELEITESSMALEAEHLDHTLSGLTRLGVSITLDDFGTGHSSLARLRRLPLRRLKVDRCFTGAVQNSDGDRRIATAIVSLALQLDLEVIAEGVETGEQYAFMREAGCQLFQGFMLSPPVATLDECRPWAGGRGRSAPLSQPA